MDPNKQLDWRMPVRRLVLLFNLNAIEQASLALGIFKISFSFETTPLALFFRHQCNSSFSNTFAFSRKYMTTSISSFNPQNLLISITFNRDSTHEGTASS
uniref:Uncharacterized protein n=1 Tax=Opuntia streptacantha TaxID=393608 RepID=A0A7C9EVF9_OPUST